MFFFPQAETVDGVPANMTGDVFSKFDKNYGLVCLNKDQQRGICYNYRIRFLCGKLGTFEPSGPVYTFSDLIAIAWHLTTTKIRCGYTVVDGSRLLKVFLFEAFIERKAFIKGLYIEQRKKLKKP